ERRSPVLVLRNRGRESRELIRDRRRRHRFPGGKRARDRGLEFLRADTAAAALRNEVADRRLRPLERDVSSADANAELEIRDRGLRLRANERDADGNRDPAADPGARAHFVAPASARTRCSNSPSGSRARERSPRTIVVRPAAGSIAGGVTTHPD